VATDLAKFEFSGIPALTAFGPAGSYEGDLSRLNFPVLLRRQFVLTSALFPPQTCPTENFSSPSLQVYLLRELHSYWRYLPVHLAKNCVTRQQTGAPVWYIRTIWAATTSRRPHPVTNTHTLQHSTNFLLRPAVIKPTTSGTTHNSCTAYPSKVRRASSILRLLRRRYILI